MANFYVPNYTEEEFEELDNKVLLYQKKNILNWELNLTIIIQ